MQQLFDKFWTLNNQRESKLLTRYLVLQVICRNGSYQADRP